MNQELVKRYQESYNAAGTTMRFGNGLRAFGCLLGMAGVIWGLVEVAHGCNRCASWLIGIGIVSALVLSIFGVIIASQGRILRATLDSSVSADATLSSHEQDHLRNFGR